MEATLHKANSRGFADLGWLKSYHTFSFAGYHDPERMGFGTLRVLNDDVIAASMGFDTHPHNNMEIISVPISGALRHKDTMGNEYVIRKGEIQTMTAGTGVAHSEFNNSSEEEANFLQIWVLPKEQNVEPNYSQKEFSVEARVNQLQLIVSPDGRDESVSINQDAFFSLITLGTGKIVEYQKYLPNNGLYVFVMSGEVKVGDFELTDRDGLGLKDFLGIELESTVGAELLLMEIPV